MNSAINLAATAQTRARYNRITHFYDSLESGGEGRFKAWRQMLWLQVRGDILEVGVGTGKNLPYYPHGARVIAIDIADPMLDRAQKRAQELGVAADLRVGDVQALDFPDNSFDTVIATFVFCCIPTPWLRELGRVVKPGGQILLLEHVRVDRPLDGASDGLVEPARRTHLGRKY